MKVEIRIGYLIGVIAALALSIWLISSWVGRNRDRVIDALGWRSSVSDTIRVYDSTLYAFYDTIPVPVQIIDSVPYTFYDTLTYFDTIPIPEPIDTAGIIEDYYRLRIYDEVFADDKIEFHLWEQVGANRILKRSTSYRILQPTSIVTQKNHYVYVGFMAYNKGTAPVLTYTNDRLYFGAGYDPFGKTLMFGGGVRLIKW